MHYYHDCVAAQLDWTRALSTVDNQREDVVGLTLEQQRLLGAQSHLELSEDAALQLAKRASTQGGAVQVDLGALFLVGELPPRRERGAQRVFAPLLTTPVSLELLIGQGQVRVSAAERELSINYGLIAELLGNGDDPDAADDIVQHLQGLAELVPDFPIEDEEFHRFWQGFQALAGDLPLQRRLPPGPGDQPWATGASHSGGELVLCDYFSPLRWSKQELRLLPATALLASSKSGAALTVLHELRELADMPLGKTAAAQVFREAPARSPRDFAAEEPLAGSDIDADIDIDTDADDLPDAIDGEPTRAERVAAAKAAERDVLERLPLPISLTEAQAAVVHSARTAPLTVVTGPPGTGKSYTITAIVLDALQSGQTVLIASQMDKAIEVVVDQVESLLGDTAIARSGGREAQRSLSEKLKRLTGPRAQLARAPAGASRRPDACRQAHDDLASAGAELERLERKFMAAVADERLWSRLWRRSQRLEPVCPLPILDLPPSLLKKAERAVASASHNSRPDAAWLRRCWGAYQTRRARRLVEAPPSWETNFDELEELLEVQRVRRERRQVEQRLPADFQADRLWEEVRRAFHRRNQYALRHVQVTRQSHLDELTANERQRAQLRQLATLLSKRRHDLKRSLREGLDADVLLWAFPVWASTNRALSEVLPATPGLFDLVVIDEASQCDPATAATALVRGKRAVIVGDPAQLRHVSFLGRARERAAVARCALPEADHQRHGYRRSLFDIAADVVPREHFFLLNEHFRSHPQIIQFSNREFYDGQLRIMTARPTTSPQRAVWVHRVNGARRGRGSVNEVERECVVERLRALMNEHRAEPLSLGVVSPFREHIDAVLDRILKEFSADELQRHRLVVGTAHSFQGDEKDVVILTTSIDPASHAASLRFLESPNLLNVALTRARRRLEVVTSVDVNELPPGHFRRFLETVGEPWAPWEADPIDLGAEASTLAAELHRRLSEHELDVWRNFEASGERVDLVAGNQRRQVAVLVDDDDEEGRPWSAEEVLASHYRLSRAGWSICRIARRIWSRDWHAGVGRIIAELDHEVGTTKDAKTTKR
ncbi:MAG: AAA family ATPase [Planctomycetales bacterium]|nr:AAA family ATPase [Planctomycetales bacterium]